MRASTGKMCSTSVFPDHARPSAASACETRERSPASSSRKRIAYRRVPKQHVHGVRMSRPAHSAMARLRAAATTKASRLTFRAG